MWISIKSHDFAPDAPKESPSVITPPPRFGPRPPPSAMFHHFPKYEPAVEVRRPADELQWDALFGIPQIGCESIIAASYSTEEITTTEIDDDCSFSQIDYPDITAGICL